MGHKVNAIGFRTGITRDWQSAWFAEKDYRALVAEDILIRAIIQKELSNASVSQVRIERTASSQVKVKICTAKPGLVIGKNGEKATRLKALLEKRTKKSVDCNAIEIRQPELSATLVARGIAEQLEKRASYKKAMKSAIDKTMRANALGIRVLISGRVGGVEIARSEKEMEGTVPLHTLRANIEYAVAEAHTIAGTVGVKVWIHIPNDTGTSMKSTGEKTTSIIEHAHTTASSHSRTRRNPQRSTTENAEGESSEEK